MESNKGAMKWLVGTGVLILIFYGIWILSSQLDNKIQINKTEMREDFLRFDKDMYETEASITQDKKGKDRALEKAKDIDYELEAIQKEKIEQQRIERELQEKNQKVFDTLERNYDKFEESDSFFN